MIIMTMMMLLSLNNYNEDDISEQGVVFRRVGPLLQSLPRRPPAPFYQTHTHDGDGDGDSTGTHVMMVMEFYFIKHTWSIAGNSE